jgi:hypothetical protein
VVPNRIYVVSEEVAKKLREAGVRFTELSRESNAPSLELALVKEYDLFVPLYYNDGRPVEPQQFQTLQ